MTKARAVRLLQSVAPWWSRRWCERVLRWGLYPNTELASLTDSDFSADNFKRWEDASNNLADLEAI